MICKKNFYQNYEKHLQVDRQISVVMQGRYLISVMDYTLYVLGCAPILFNQILYGRTPQVTSLFVIYRSDSPVTVPSAHGSFRDDATKKIIIMSDLIQVKYQNKNITQIYITINI